MPKIYACFLKSDSELLEKHVLNMAAAYFSPSSSDGAPMVHAEIFFPTRDDERSVLGRSCGIHYGGHVFLQEKRFTKKNWIFRAITCTDEQYKTMLEYCRSQRGGEFNYLGYFTPCGSTMESRLLSDGPQRWYCSELTAAILHAGGIIDCVEDASFTAHPQTLYNKLERITYADCGRNLDKACLQI